MNTTHEMEQAAGAHESLRRPDKHELDPEALAIQGAVDPDVAARLKAERVQEMLKAMPQWQSTLEGRAINRVKEFPTAAVAAHFGGFVIALAGALGMPVTVTVSGGQVLVTLYGRRERGQLVTLTHSVVELAQQIG